MQVDSLMVKEGSQGYYTDKMFNTLEDFMPTFRKDVTSPTVIAPATAERFAGDLNGLLTFLGLPPYLFYPVMRVNNLNSSDEYQPSMTNLLIPNQTEITRILQTNNSTNRAST